MVIEKGKDLLHDMGRGVQGLLSGIPDRITLPINNSFKH